MRIALDTNIVLDVLLARQPFAADSAELMARIEEGKAVGLLAATTITTINYLLSKAYGRPAALEAVRQLLRLCEIAPVNRDVLTSASLSKISDFEDAVLHDAALSFRVDAVVTRDPKDLGMRV